MTDTKLTAGHAADALVAEAMGWWNNGTADESEWKAGKFDYRGRLPEFTTSGDGMLAMVQWMRNRTWAVTLESPDEHLPDFTKATEWQCHVFVNGIEWTCCESADTAPLAVAEALLAAVAATEETT